MIFRCGNMTASFLRSVNQCQQKSESSESSDSSDWDSQLSDFEGSSDSNNEEGDEIFPLELINVTPEKFLEVRDVLRLNHTMALAFLLFEEKLAFQDIRIIVESGSVDTGRDKITAWVNSKPDNWQSKLLEALTIIQHNQAVAMMGVSTKEANAWFQPFLDVKKPYLSRVKRILYRFMGSMTIQQANKLMKLVRSDEKFKPEEDVLFNVSGKFIELHILFLADIGYINIKDETLDLTNLVKHFQLNHFSIDELMDIKVRDLNKMLKDLKTPFCEDSRKYSQPPLVIPFSEEVYQITNQENVGLVIIISQEEFYKEKNPTVKNLLPQEPLSSRRGNSEDVKNITNTFTNLNFTVVVNNNVDSWDLVNVIENRVEEYFRKDHSVLILCILSHGNKGVIYCANSIPISIEEIKNSLCGPAMIELRGKPKIVIVQACQGEKKLFADPDELSTCEEGNSQHEKFSEDNSSATTLSKPQSISPDFADLMFCLATVEGYSVVRCPQKGTFYIQELCKLLRQYSKSLHFSDIMTRVHLEINRKKLHLSINKPIGNCREHNRRCIRIKMTPVKQYDSFTKELYLVQRPPTQIVS